MTGLGRRFGWLVVLSAAGFLLSFGNQLVISFYFGTSPALDAYWALFAAAGFLLFYVHPLREALIPPVFSAMAQDRDRSSALLTAGVAALVLLASASALLLLALPAGLLDWLGIGRSAPGALLTGFVVYCGLFALAETCNGLLLSFNRVVYQAVARLVAAVLSLLCLLMLAGRIGVLALLASLLLAQLVTLLISLVALRREGLRLLWRGFAPLWQESRLLPVFFSLLFSYLLAQAYVVFERVTLLGMAPGLVAAFQYSTTLVNVLISLLAYPLANLLWPRFLGHQARGDSGAMLDLAGQVAAPLALVLLACCAFVYRFAPEVVGLVFSRGAFGPESVERTVLALRASIFAALPIGMIAIFSRVLLSQGRARAMAVVGTGIALGGSGVIALGAWLGDAWVVQWHWTIGNTVGMILVLLAILRQIAQPGRRVAYSVFWMVRAAGIVGLALWLTPVFISTGLGGQIMGLVLSFAIFALGVTVLAQLTRLVDLLHWPGT